MQPDQFTQKFIDENPELKKAYQEMLLQEFKLRELNLRSNLNNLKMRIAKGKDDKGRPKLEKEKF